MKLTGPGLLIVESFDYCFNVITGNQATHIFFFMIQSATCFDVALPPFDVKERFSSFSGHFRRELFCTEL